MDKITQGAVDDGTVYDKGGFPSIEGNDPNRVCRDFKVPLQGRRMDEVPPKAQPTPTNRIATKVFIDKALGKAYGKRTKEYGPPPMKGPRIEFCAHPTMLAFQPPFPTSRFDDTEGLEPEQWVGPTSLFFQTVHECFSKHYSLALSPDLLMYLVLHEVSICVKQHSEEYAKLFTERTDGMKELIHVRHDGLRMGNPTSPWGEVLGLFNTGLSDRVPSEILKHALPAFSTHTTVTQAASMVAFMDAASPYFSFRCMTMCGIPTVRLLGVPEDYRKLLNACCELSVLFDKHLDDYFGHLIPVLSKIATQAEGAPMQVDFWSSIYKHLSESGTDDMSGWITAFINYVSQDGALVPKDHYVGVVQPEQTGWPSGIPRADIPCHVNRVGFVWDYLGSEYPMEFIGGVLGRENLDGFVVPRLGYGIVHKDD